MVERIVVVDCGAQYGPLIARRVRELNVYSELVPHDITLQYILDNNVKGIIISGGPSSVYDAESPKPDIRLFNSGVPVLGICYGHQHIVYALGGRVQQGSKEFGHSTIKISHTGKLLKGLKPEEDVWMSHGDHVTSLPTGFAVYASSKNCPIAAYGSEERDLYGVQFHPEVVHTINGKVIIKNFVYDICGCEQNWTMEDYIPRAIEEIKSAVGKDRAVIALSGGIDSTTAAALGEKAIGEKLSAVYVDTGLMRYGETEEIERIFKDIDLKVIREEDRFYKALKCVKNPERKRRIIGDLFAKILDDHLSEVGASYLLQGTIYSDIIESAAASGDASKIKTHHNVGSRRIQEMREGGEVVEPLRYLFKDEVRMVAERIGIPAEKVWRQPFPGPGLAVRIEGMISPEKIDIVRAADRIVAEEVERAYTLHERPWQYFAVLTRSMATGVKGDARSYGHVVAVRAVDSEDAMTADSFEFHPDVLKRIGRRIPNEIPGVTRVLYEITSKPPATMEWE